MKICSSPIKHIARLVGALVIAALALAVGPAFAQTGYRITLVAR
jgi:hypothetical protein